jgi:sulfatase maturation enzyme AslB (radical SAM superfamily)
MCCTLPQQRLIRIFSSDKIQDKKAIIPMHTKTQRTPRYSRRKTDPPPYHTFECLGDYFVFDTSTCRFYQIDKPKFRFLELCRSMTISEAKKTLRTSMEFSDDVVNDTASFILKLARNGLFDVPDFSMSKKEIKEKLEKIEQTPLYSVELMLADTCNLACKYCFCETCRDILGKGLMKKNTARQAVDMLFAKSGKLEILFFSEENPF